MTMKDDPIYAEMVFQEIHLELFDSCIMYLPRMSVRAYDSI